MGCAWPGSIGGALPAPNHWCFPCSIHRRRQKRSIGFSLWKPTSLAKAPRLPRGLWGSVPFPHHAGDRCWLTPVTRGTGGDSLLLRPLTDPGTGGGGCPRPAASPAPGVSVRGVRLSVLLEQKKRSLELKFRRRFYTQSPALCQGRPWGTDTSTKPPQSTGAARCPYCCPDWRSWLSRQPWVLYLGSFLLMLT